MTMCIEFENSTTSRTVTTSTSEGCSSQDDRLSQDHESQHPPQSTASTLAAAGFLPPIPDLKCYICTPTPTFSNTSHLLTHLGSKSHLRADFEVKLNAFERQDKDSLSKLEANILWYNKHNVGAHLVQRFVMRKGKWSREKVKDPYENTPAPDGCIAASSTSENGQDAEITTMLLKEARDVTRTKNVKKELNGMVRGAAQPCGVEKSTPIRGRRSTRPLRVKKENTQFPGGDRPVKIIRDGSEHEIVDGPDRGVLFSSKGPRLRGKIWPGMAVFGTTITSGGRRIFGVDGIPDEYMASGGQVGFPSANGGDLGTSTSGNSYMITPKLEPAAQPINDDDADMDSDVDGEGIIDDEEYYPPSVSHGTIQGVLYPSPTGDRFDYTAIHQQMRSQNAFDLPLHHRKSPTEQQSRQPLSNVDFEGLTPVSNASGANLAPNGGAMAWKVEEDKENFMRAFLGSDGGLDEEGVHEARHLEINTLNQAYHNLSN